MKIIGELVCTEPAAPNKQKICLVETTVRTFCHPVKVQTNIINLTNNWHLNREFCDGTMKIRIPVWGISIFTREAIDDD